MLAWARPDRSLWSDSLKGEKNYQCVCPRRQTEGITAPGTRVTGTFKSPKEDPGTLTPCCRLFFDLHIPISGHTQLSKGWSWLSHWVPFPAPPWELTTVTSDQEGPMPSSDFLGHRYTHMQCTLGKKTHNNKPKKLKTVI